MYPGRHAMKAIVFRSVCTLALLASSQLAFAADTSKDDFTNFRFGIAATTLDIDPGADYFPSSDDTGVSLFAEFPQTDHAASRFLMYRIHQDGKDVTGFETQLMWGWGLSQPGFRLYTGPAWHREKIVLQSNSGRQVGVFNGWGWQIGTGYQLGAVTLDIAGTFRDDQDYRNQNRRSGAAGQRPNVWLTSALISYRF
tara:strand:+ start:407 stop:997 length:591 start_codon:yes stop_codon:yes gene_type:complete